MNVDDRQPSWIIAPDDLSADHLRCEYLVVGSGAGGSVAAKTLAEAGKDVLVIEEGGYWPAEALPYDFSGGLNRLYRNNGIVPFLGSPMVPFAEAQCVGGGTTINGALFWRTPEWILNAWRDEQGLEGYGSADLASHFDTLESDLKVAQQPLDFESNRDSQLLFEGARSLGWKTSSVPRAVLECKNVNLCPIGCAPCGKQSTIYNYLPRLGAAGGRVLTGCRATRIERADGQAASVQARLRQTTGDRGIRIDFDHIIIAGGPVQSPLLLRRSDISRTAGNQLQFHMNLKIVALFPDEVRADRGTIYTMQLQEFEREGLLIMPSNLLPHLLATTATHHGDHVVDHLLSNYSRSAIYVAMIRARSLGRVHRTPFGRDATVRYRFDPRDLSAVHTALRRSAQVLFAAGASELYMPVSKSGSVRSVGESEVVLKDLRPSDLEIVTVHAMSSCAMGPNRDSSVVSPDGSLWGMSNVTVADASVLPTTTGESPQGTIMALASEVISRHLADYS